MFKSSKKEKFDLAEVYDQVENQSSPSAFQGKNKGVIFKILKFFCLAIIFFVLLLLMAVGRELPSLFVLGRDVLAGKEDVENAVLSAKNENFKEAMDLSQSAEKNFNSSRQAASFLRGNFFVSKSKFLDRQFADLENLLATAEILSRGLRGGLNFFNEIAGLLEEEKKLTFSKFTMEEKKRILAKFYESEPELSGIKANLDLAAISLENVHRVGFLKFYDKEISSLAENINYARDLLDRSIPLCRILPGLAGYPEKASYLILLQNSDELRATGGFIGTYGILEIEGGDILRFDTHDVYHLDMPVKDRMSVAPPEPLKKYLGVGKWFFRDSNWSPDWPTAARQADWFFEKQDALLAGKERINNFNGEFSGLIGITPELVMDLLALTGPIVIEGQEYNPENFKELLEYRVEKGYVELGVPKWQRKEVIGQILRKMKIKLFDLPSTRWREVLDVLEKNFARKDILLYAKDQALEDLIKERNWGGEIKTGQGDFLMVVDANMAALKTDAVMTRRIDYKVSAASGVLSAEASVNYAHGGGFDWRTTRYRSYVRIYAPRGSRLLSAEVNGKELSPGDVAVLEEFGSEGKTSFGFFVSIEPGEIGGFKIRYELPRAIKNLADAGRYELYAQRQPGAGSLGFRLDFKGEKVIKSYSPTSFNRQSGEKEIGWETDFDSDKKFIVNF